MKKIFKIFLFFVILFVSAYFFADMVFGAWTISTNQLSKYTRILTFVSSASNDSATTNFNLSQGFLKNKLTPTRYWTYIMTNVSSAGAYVPTTVGILWCNKTNIQVSKPSAGTGYHIPMRMKFKVYIEYPHTMIR